VSERRRKGLLVAAAIWIVILGLLAVGYKYLIHPLLQDKLVDSTGTESRYKHTVRLRLDAFSGYAVLRSPALQKLLLPAGIRLAIEDDKADYLERLKALRDDDAELAVFTVDALIKAGAELGEYPATIVLVIDETVGADAIVGYRKGLADLQGLDREEARIVATPNSPSEFLARAVIATLSLPNLPEKWLVEQDGAGAVYAKLRAASGDERGYAYVLWEPYVSKALKLKDVHVLLDSSKMKGYIVDVLVARRDFLAENKAVVKAVVEAYLRAAYSHGKSADGMAKLVAKDAKRAGEPLSEEEARKLASGIRWKNTLENYAHLGVGANPTSGADGAAAENLEDVISKIADVLLRTGAIERNPLDGKAHTLFFNDILAELQAAGFHPAKKINVIEGMGPGTGDLQAGAKAVTLPELSAEEWKKLRPVGTMRVEPIAFRRGTADISALSRSELDALAQRFNSWPSYYLEVIGNARAEGDVQANRELARQRAQATLDYLVEQGVARHRLRSSVAALHEAGRARAETAFRLLQQSF
jgi:hypothetical protein